MHHNIFSRPYLRHPTTIILVAALPQTPYNPNISREHTPDTVVKVVVRHWNVVPWQVIRLGCALMISEIFSIYRCSSLQGLLYGLHVF